MGRVSFLRRSRRRSAARDQGYLRIATVLAVVAAPCICQAASVSVVGDGLTLPVGSNTVVQLSIDDATGLEGIFFRIGYDGSLATATNAATTTATADCLIEFNTAPSNEVRIALACPTALAGSGDLVQVSFSGQANGITSLAVSECTLNEGTPSCSATAGSLSVTSCLLDVDGSGGAAEVATDIMYIARRALGLDPVPSSFRVQDPSIPSDTVVAARIDTLINSGGLDVDDSGDLDVATDVVYIARHLLGLGPVPSSFRPQDPPIPTDEVISANVTALCP